MNLNGASSRSWRADRVAGALPLNLSKTTFWTVIRSSLVNSASPKKNQMAPLFP